MDVTPAQLATYLGTSSIEAERAALLLDLAVEACEEIVSPLPDAARGVVLDVAATAYSTPAGPGGNVMAGPYSMQAPPGGITLSRRQLARLRRLSGSHSGVFTVAPGRGTPPIPYGNPPAVIEGEWWNTYPVEGLP